MLLFPCTSLSIEKKSYSLSLFRNELLNFSKVDTVALGLMAFAFSALKERKRIEYTRSEERKKEMGRSQIISPSHSNMQTLFLLFPSHRPLGLNNISLSDIHDATEGEK